MLANFYVSSCPLLFCLSTTTHAMHRGMSLRDLTYYEEDLNTVPDGQGLINFKQSKNVYNVLKSTLVHQNCPFPFEVIPSLQQLLFDLEVPETDDDLYKMSLDREPRNVKRNEVL